MKKQLITTLFLVIISNSLKAQSCDKTGFQTMTYDRALLKSLEILGKEYDYKLIGHSYLSYFKPKLFSKIKNDEFLYYDEIKKASTELKNSVDNYKNQCFYMTAMVNFGKYDFEKNTFPLYNFNGKFTFDARSVKNRGDWGQLPQTITIRLLNKERVKGLAMDREEAKSYLKAIKTKYGHVNRRVLHNFYLKPFDIDKTNKDNWLLYVKLVKIDAFKDSKGKDINESYNL